MARRILVLGQNNEIIMNAEEFPGEKNAQWRFVRTDYGPTLISGTREQVISHICELIVRNSATQIQVGHEQPYHPDGAGNIWLKDQYLPPTIYLPIIIPDKEDETE